MATRLYIVAALTALLGFSPSATAQSDKYLTYREYKQNPGAWALYLAGAYDGFGWANAELSEGRGQSQLYCQPPNLALRHVDVEAILNSFMVGKATMQDYPVNMLALMALQDRLPC